MPTFDDLKRAQSEGVITAEQFDKISKYLEQERGQISLQAAEEAPRFFRSFNDIFIGIGVIIFSIALIVIAYQVDRPGYSFAVAAGCIWLMAEWMTGYLKINFPSIILNSFFTIFCFISALQFIGFSNLFSKPEDVINGFSQLLMVPYVVGFIASLLFYLRFRLPFSLFVLSSSFVYLISSIVQTYFLSDFISSVATGTGQASQSVFYALFIVNFFTLIIGIGIFYLAMRFDMKDPLRVGRYSDNGFWLHLCAGPLLCNCLIAFFMLPILKGQLTSDDIQDFGGLSLLNDLSTTFNSFLIVAVVVFILLSVISLIIDRRAMLISSLLYLGFAIGYVIYNLKLEANIVLAISMLLVSAIILFLGVGWHRLRSLLFRVLPNYAFFQKLPPLVKKQHG